MVDFEAGQVWEIGWMGNLERVVCASVNHHGHGISTDGKPIDPTRSRLVAPAPKPGQRWVSGAQYVRVKRDQDYLIASAEDPFGACCASQSVVDLACWLHTNGYKPCEERPCVELKSDDLVRCDRDRCTGRAIRPSSTKGDDFDIAWTDDGAVEQSPMGYSDQEAASCLAAGLWTIVKQVPAKPRVELRDGMRVRLDVGGITGELQRTGSEWTGRWSDGDEEVYQESDVVRCIESGRWTVVDGAPRASARSSPVPAAPTPWTRTDSRRAIDAAAAKLNGQPFAHAIQAALVGLAERRNITQREIDGAIPALRHWESKRPFERDLIGLKARNNDFVRGGPWNRLQLECCELFRRAIGDLSPMWNYDSMFFVYERARATR